MEFEVSIQLNRLYLKFLKRNPGYDGKVSIYGHSLGSVLSYDILCHQESLSSPFPMDWMYKEHARNEESSPDVNNQSSLLTAKAMDSKQPGSEKDVDELLCDSSDIYTFSEEGCLE
nr:phospholipase sgr2 [Quercus suber]